MYRLYYGAFMPLVIFGSSPPCHKALSEKQCYCSLPALLMLL